MEERLSAKELKLMLISLRTKEKQTTKKEEKIYLAGKIDLLVYLLNRISN